MKKKKNNFLYGIVASCSSFFIFFILLLIIICAVGGSSTSRIEANSNEDAIAFYHSTYLKIQSEVYNKTNHLIPFAAVKWYFLAFSVEEEYDLIYTITEGLSTLETQDNDSYCTYFLSNEPYQSQLSGWTTDDIKQWMDVANKIENEIRRNDDGYTSGGAGNTGGINQIVDFNSPYYDSLNPLSNAGYTGQCTWYVWGRVNEVNEGNYFNLPTSDAQNWFYQAPALGFNIGGTPSVNSIVVYKYGAYGHVAFVESYDEFSITISEGNIGCPVICEGFLCSVNFAKDYTNIWKGTMDQFEQRLRGYQILGYIYL